MKTTLLQLKLAEVDGMLNQLTTTTSDDNIFTDLTNEDESSLPKNVLDE